MATAKKTATHKAATPKKPAPAKKAAAPHKPATHKPVKDKPAAAKKEPAAPSNLTWEPGDPEVWKLGVLASENRQPDLK